jgi:hypothetical protein
VGLPETIQVRISSEAAGAITITPVVSQTIPLRELVWTILASIGKDRERMREMLLRGAVVQGASRFRWASLAIDHAEVEALLRLFPDADPSRPFCAERCLGVRLRAGRHAIELPRQVAAEKRLLKKRSFWDELMALAARCPPEYTDYSYRLRADEYRLRMTPGDAAVLRDAAALLRYSGLVAQVRAPALECVEYSVQFP